MIRRGKHGPCRFGCESLDRAWPVLLPDLILRLTRHQLDDGILRGFALKENGVNLFRDRHWGIEAASEAVRGPGGGDALSDVTDLPLDILKLPTVSESET